MEKVRVALVGCGGFCKGRLQPAIEESGLLDVVACYDVNADESAVAAERFGGRKCASLDDILAMAEVEGVILSTPNQFHREQTEASVAAGKDVYVEKPIANTIADGVAMTQAAKAAGRILMLGHNTRRKRAPRLARKLMTEGRIGKILGVEAHYSHSGGLKLPEDSWRADPDRAPGLPLVQLGIHAIDVVNMLLGDPEVVASLHRRAVLSRNIDCTSTIIGYGGHLTATMVSHYVTPLQVWFRVSGTEGNIEARDYYREFVVTDSKGQQEKHSFPEDLSYLDEMNAFARSIREGAPVETDGRGGVYALAIVEAAILSAREGRFVRIDELVQGL